MFIFNFFFLCSLKYDSALMALFEWMGLCLRRFELRGPLVIWNSALAIFSIIGASRTAPELIHVLRHYGLFHSVCDPRLVLLYTLDCLFFVHFPFPFYTDDVKWNCKTATQQILLSSFDLQLDLDVVVLNAHASSASLVLLLTKSKPVDQIRWPVKISFIRVRFCEISSY